MNKVVSSSDLVGRICSGDRQAEIDLVERYNRVIMKIIRRQVKDTMVADDLYQETFCIVLEKIRRGEVREWEKLPGFVCSVAKNRIIKHFLRASRQESLTEIAEIESGSHTASDQFEELLRKEKAGIVWQILKEMTNERDIHILFRFYLAEDDKKLICADLGLTNLQFSLVLHRARARYRELYERTISDK